MRYKKELSSMYYYKMEAIYIISTKKLAKENKYKVGRHTGSKDLVLSKYAKYIDDPKIYYFSKLENRCISKAINTAIKKYKIKITGIPFSFVSMNIDQLINCIDDIFDMLLPSYDGDDTFDIN